MKVMSHIEKLDKLYRRYNFRVIKEHKQCRLYLYEKGRYFGADLVYLKSDTNSIRICKEIIKQYSNGGYAVKIREYDGIEDAAQELYKSFFSYDVTAKRIMVRYKNFASNQSRLNGCRYEYVNVPFDVNNERQMEKSLAEEINLAFRRPKPQLLIIEAAAGYGKTCSAYEIMKSLLESDMCGNPLLTELARNRGANIFRYILLDEIDREYPILDSKLVEYEIQTGRIPLLIDGFDELLEKSDMVKSDKQSVFEEAETMLDTIGNLLKKRARIILTSRKTAIFAGSAFRDWIRKWNRSFEVTRYSIDVPRIKDWVGQERLDLIKSANVPLQYISNPVLLTFLKNLSDSEFQTHLENPNSLVKQYFHSMLKREMERQQLFISPEIQYLIFKNVTKLLIEFNISSEKRSFIREIIIDENQKILEEALKLYPGSNDIDLLADKLINHALLDRKGHADQVGFINEFVFGTFIGEIISETSTDEIDKNFPANMVEIGATAYRVQNSTNKASLWKKIDDLKDRFEGASLFNFDITLKGKLLRDFNELIFQSISIYKIKFKPNFKIQSSVFIKCKFKSCEFDHDVFKAVSFIECHFDDCKVKNARYLNQAKETYVIKCSQSVGSDILLFNAHSADDTDVVKLEQDENKVLEQIYNLETKFKNQRLFELFKVVGKPNRKFVAEIVDGLVRKKILAVNGLDVYIEMNVLNEVKKRINAKK